MKQIFAIFCSLVLLPSFTAQAWIGGPFSNNSYFGETGDDGVYEAVATGPNALGLFRIVVGNAFAGVNSEGVTQSLPQQGVSNTPLATLFQINNGIASGNVVLGALRSTSSNIWFVRGITYRGSTLGSVNSATQTVIGIGNAVDPANGANIVDSSFRARLIKIGRLLPASGFAGRGKFFVTTAGVVGRPSVRFTVFGNKVSDQITFGL